MDGGLGHGKSQYKSINKDTDGKNRDNIKNELAKKHNIKIIRIDCIKSDVEYIKTNIYNSHLSNIFNFDNVDWYACDKYATSNIHKQICEYWNNKQKSDTTASLAEKFNYSRSGIISILKKGTKFNWCHYNPKEEKEKSIKKSIKTNKKNNLKYVTRLNILNNERCIYYATYVQIQILNNINSPGHLSTIIKKNRTTKKLYKFYLSTDKEICYFEKHDKINKEVNGHKMYMVYLDLAK
jgi:hypothetical protein